jgi:hypothetical protein
MQQIELAPDYSEGRVTIGPYLPAGLGFTNFPPPYPGAGGGVYPYVDSSYANPLTPGLPPQVLMIEESPYVGGFVLSSATPQPNSPTNWYWNIRVGDKIRINDSGRYYTIVGPCTINPNNSATPGQNPELFVNNGPPGSLNPAKGLGPTLHRSYWFNSSVGWVVAQTHFPEFLFVVNGQDDGSPPLSATAAGLLAAASPDGYVDNGWNGFDDNLDAEIAAGASPTVDELAEWEIEQWIGAENVGSALLDNTSPLPPSASTPSVTWITSSKPSQIIHDVPYSIVRRPVPVEGSRETSLPGSVVIDATTWNLPLPERSRLPVDPSSLTCDILINPNGQVVPQTIYSTPISFNEPFFHFWLTDRTDVASLTPWDPTTQSPPTQPALPMPQGTPNYTGTAFLKGNRKLVTLFTKSGYVSIDDIVNFNGTDVNAPFYDVQLGSTSGGE